jgi:anti-sigma factor RsiW
MNCSQFDLKGYYLGEPGEAGRAEVEEHLKVCAACREELSRLRLTGLALASVPDEEMPHRIAFLPDRTYQPSGWLRFWNSAPRLGFASAAMLSAAILVHGLLGMGQVRKTEALVAEAERRIQTQRQADLVSMDQSIEWLYKKMNTYYLTSATYGGRP